MAENETDLGGLPLREDGRISTEDLGAFLRATAEADRDAMRGTLEAMAARKLAAVEELMGLGISQASAQLIVGYEDEGE